MHDKISPIVQIFNFVNLVINDSKFISEFTELKGGKNKINLLGNNSLISLIHYIGLVLHMYKM